MKMFWGKRRRFDKGTAPVRYAFRRTLRFEQMEERLTLSTTAASPGLIFQNTANIEGGLITVGNSQMLFQDSGVIDSDGLSSLYFSGTPDSVPILNVQGTDVITSGLNGGLVVPRGDSSLDVLGGGLEHIAKIAPLESVAPSQPEGGQVQIAMLFDPFFELGPTRGAGGELAADTGKEPLGETPENRSVSQEFAPVQGRDIAFEVASTVRESATVQERSAAAEDSQLAKRDEGIESRPETGKPKEAPDAAPVSKPTKPAAVRPAAHVPARLATAPLTSIPAKQSDEQTEPSEPPPDQLETARDQVFAEWPGKAVQHKRTAAVQAPTAPLSEDRERSVTPAEILSGVVVLSAGIHYALTHSRDSLKETEQLVGLEE